MRSISFYNNNIISIGYSLLSKNKLKIYTTGSTILVAGLEAMYSHVIVHNTVHLLSTIIRLALANGIAYNHILLIFISYS